jgi:hypothetical protein
VRVDKTGHDVLALGVDFDIARRTPRLPTREAPGSRVTMSAMRPFSMTVFFRSRCGSAVAFDDEGVVDDETWVAAAADDDAGLSKETGGGQ